MKIRTKPPEQAFVYAIKRKDGAIKIGFSCDIPARIATLKSQSIADLKAVYWLLRSRPDAYGVEQLAHWIARDRRIEKEWFNITEEEASSVINAAAARYEQGERAPRLADLPEMTKTRIGLLLDKDTISRLTEWRARQSPLPNTSAAIRRLLIEALDRADVSARPLHLTPESKSGDMNHFTRSQTTRVAIGASLPRQ